MTVVVMTSLMTVQSAHRAGHASRGGFRQRLRVARTAQFRSHTGRNNPDDVYSNSTGNTIADDFRCSVSHRICNTINSISFIDFQTLWLLAVQSVNKHCQK